MLLVIVFAGCANKKKFSEQSNLEYTLSSCSLDFQLEPKVGNFEHTWIDDSTLEVKTYVKINCGESIENAHFKIDKAKINLFYKSPVCKPYSKPFCEKCLCYQEITYNIKNIKKENFSFSLSRIE